MNRYNHLINTIADEFHISQGKTEADDVWKARVIYSLLGRMGYASLWDIQEDFKPISIIHFKRRISSVLESYLEMYPEIRPFYFDDIDNLSNEIYEIFLKTGNIYHCSYRISPAIRCVSEISGLYLMRGMPLNQIQYISGIGNYSLVKEDVTTIQPNDMFQLQGKNIIEQWRDIKSNANWKPIPAETRIEYLRTKPPFKYGYWGDTPDTTGTVSIARSRVSDYKIYFLYKIIGGEILGSQLPEWLVADYNYRILSNGCLAANSNLPAAAYHIDGHIVQVKINYLPPPAELNLIKLYSWPQTYVGLPHDFSRIFELQVFLAIMDIMKPIGYQFIEV